jgi:hypothetical protein
MATQVVYINLLRDMFYASEYSCNILEVDSAVLNHCMVVGLEEE